MLAMSRTDDNDDIIFGRRDQVTMVNTLTTNYTFTNNMVLSFRLRHYWSGVEYSSFHLLAEDGTLQDTDYDTFSDNSFNAFNIDAVYPLAFCSGQRLVRNLEKLYSRFCGFGRVGSL